jgi:hypothetical protein
MVITLSGEIYVAFHDTSNNIYVYKYASGIWKQVDIIDIGQETTFKLASDSTGAAYLAFRDSGNNLNVKRLSDKQPVFSVNSPTDISQTGHINLMFDNSNTPLITYINTDQKLVVGYYDSDGWNRLTAEYDNIGTPIAADINNNTLYTAFTYLVEALRYLAVVSYTAGGNITIFYTTAPITFSGGQINIAYYNNKIYLVYVEGKRILAKEVASGSWNDLGGGTVYDSGENPEPWWPSIATDNGGRPYVAFQNSSGNLSVRRLEENQWVDLGSIPQAGANAIDLLFKSDAPFVAVNESGPSVLYYGYW